MPAGEAFTARQQEDIERVLRLAHEESGLFYSVYVGSLEGDPREYAEKLHGALEKPNDSVLVAVDPGVRRLEIVTGPNARRYLDDRACGLAALTMTTAFAAGDLVGGICSGIRSLSEHARHPKTLHLDTP
ncbi:DUF5130 domain-containing protein [Carbonactinospora thermoautotrophica]|uniref:DUF5130 domain-containing protein n=1 Tax=Carbonactinospora thermoautotrophica TaxID=1469144 RepID=A0A132MQD5_9ACTN|nr:DUF5130 family protein [Carbonactinospora thermoautotrophica]KWX00043.1 hypothetical protein TH66_13865 [Carbonactinospora thermoautotrophica]KWX02044.1 hypothetical protein LI90_3082 [Carbonactinospora thermoautotrophica]KWX08644.1 hypothetical protein TR74_14060 [Carbonactinospora thermoautotrophica]MCX9189970.1 DUF5130 domain-containing protein [Carbonactinospora thermoautotrophica]